MHCSFTPLSQWTIVTKGPYKILIADSLCKRIQGLQGTKSLPENTLMLFHGIYPGIYFHTRNCLFDMDIVPISNSVEVLDIFTAKPESSQIGPMPYLTSKVLEAPAFWFKKNSIRPGDYVPLLNL